MSDRKQVSRKKTTASNLSNPSLAPNIPSLPTPSHNLGGESHQTTPQTVQLETSQKQELTVEQQENQENIDLNESAFDDTNYLQRVSFIPRYSIQRQELQSEKEEHKENSEVIQTKLNVSEPGDKQEGVSIWNKAFQIQRSEDSKLDKPIESFNYLEKATIFRPQETVQRQEELEKEEQEEGEFVQAKLTVGEPGDKYEQEADTTAAKIMAMSDETLQRQTEEETEEIQPQENPNLNPASINATEEEIQTKAKGNNIQTSSNLENRLGNSKGGGNPLPDDVRGFMEPRFGADFSQVRVHTDSSAVEMNQELSAQAFAHGNDIYYGAGKSPGNDELTAHELTHTIQQTGGTSQGKFLTKEENEVQHKAIFPLQMKETPVGEEVNQTSPDSVENPQNNQQAETGETPRNVRANQTSPQNRDAIAPQENTAVTGENSTSSQETANSQIEASSNEPTDLTQANSRENLQGNQETTPEESGDRGINTEGNQNNNATVSETTSQETAPASPDSDPGFQAVVAKAKGVANQEKQHEPATAETEEAQNAAVSPGNEIESQAQNRQLLDTEQQPTGSFNAEAFKAALMERIEAVIPDNQEDAEEFGDNNELESVREDVSSQVSEEQQQAANPIQEGMEAQPDTGGIEARSSTPMEAPETGTATTNIGAEQAVPNPRPESQVSAPLEANVGEIDQQMQENNITQEQLANANEPQFNAALEARNEIATHASQAPSNYRQQELQTLNQAQSEAQATSETHLTQMHGDRTQLLTQVGGSQNQTQTQDEQERTKIANKINEIYQQSKADVETVLSGLDEEVTSKFDAGARVAKQKFETHVKTEMSAWEEKRYGKWYDVTGYDERLSDAWHGLPPEVNEFFVDGKKLYLDEMDVTLTDIANLVAERLNEAKQKITEGRQKVEEYVASLPTSLQQIGQQAAQEIQTKFDELEDTVNSKQDELIDSLAQRYSESLQEVNTRIEQMQSENRGLKDKALDAIGGVIETILKLKEMLTSVLSKVADTVTNIIQDPIGFLGNLISGIKQGFENFVGNIWEHLQGGLIGWLTGSLGSMGIQLPDDIFSLSGIFDLVTQILGLTWDYVRGKAVKLFGEPVVAAMEEAVEIFQILQSDGLAGVWEYLKDQFSNLKEMVIDQIKEMVITQVITAGVKWIIGLLNPASAFVKAAMAIYDIIMFFVNRGSQVLELVNSVVDAVGAIASGAVGGAAKLVENALAKSIPVVIGFLASLLGIGDLAQKVQDIVGNIRERVDKAIDKVLLKAKGLFKGKKGKDKDGKDGKFSEKDRKAGLAAFEKEEKPFVKDGAINQADARKVGKIVQDKHPVFKSITVVDGKDSWDYKYVFRSDDVDTSSKKAENAEVSTSDKPENWEYIKKFIDKVAPTTAPEGYSYYNQKPNGSFLIRRDDAKDDKFQKLSIEPVNENGKIVNYIRKGSPGSERISKSSEMDKNFGKAKPGYNRHHLIPDEVVRKHTLTKAAMNRGVPKYNLDAATNLIYLPSSEVEKNKPKNKDLPLHSGSHPKWNEHARNRLDIQLSILKRKHSKLEQTPDENLTTSVKKVESRLRVDLKIWASKMNKIC